MAGKRTVLAHTPNAYLRVRGVGPRGERGAISLIGAVFVLLLFALALAAALGYAKKIRDHSEVQAGVQGLLTVKQNVKEAYRFRDSYFGLDTNSATAGGLVPELLQTPVVTGGVFQQFGAAALPNGDAWIVVGYPYFNSNPTQIAIGIYTKDVDACIAYSQALVPGASQVQAGSLLSAATVVGSWVTPLTGGALYGEIAKDCGQFAGGSGFVDSYVLAVY